MPTSNTVGQSLGGSLKAAIEIQKPEIGAKLLLQWSPYHTMHEIPGAQPMTPGTYVEVEVTAIKTAKLLLE